VLEAWTHLWNTCTWKVVHWKLEEDAFGIFFTKFSLEYYLGAEFAACWGELIPMGALTTFTLFDRYLSPTVACTQQLTSHIRSCIEYLTLLQCLFDTLTKKSNLIGRLWNDLLILYSALALVSDHPAVYMLYRNQWRSYVGAGPRARIRKGLLFPTEGSSPYSDVPPSLHTLHVFLWHWQ